MILIVTYELRGPHNYLPFYEAIKKQGNWWHYLASTWLLSTSKAPIEVYNEIAPLMLNTDSLLIAEMGSSQPQGWLPKAAWDWIQQQQQNEALSKLGAMPSAKGLASLAALATPSQPGQTTTTLADLLRGLPKKGK